MSKTTTLYEKLKEARNAYRASGDTFAYTLIGTLIGEIDRTKKTSSEVISDKTVIAAAKKMSSSSKENAAVSKHDAVKARFEREVEILAAFIPAQMSEDEIREIAKTQPTLKEFMMFMSKSYAGLFDGKLASSIWNGIQVK